MTEWEFPGWRFLGAFPEGAPNDVGSWLLHHNGEGAILEVPPGVTVSRELQVEVKFLLASHRHADHFDVETWNALSRSFPRCKPLPPDAVLNAYTRLSLGGEPLWLIRSPKHSLWDVVTVFRGVAMTGDVELGRIDSVNREVNRRTKVESMRRLAEFQEKCGYQVHTVMSAHLNDLRTDVDWPSLFKF